MKSQLEINQEEALVLIARQAIAIGVIGNPVMAETALKAQAAVLDAKDGGGIITAINIWKNRV